MLQLTNLGGGGTLTIINQRLQLGVDPLLQPSARPWNTCLQGQPRPSQRVILLSRQSTRCLAKRVKSYIQQPLYQHLPACGRTAEVLAERSLPRHDRGRRESGQCTRYKGHTRKHPCRYMPEPELRPNTLSEFLPNVQFAHRGAASGSVLHSCSSNFEGRVCVAHAYRCASV